MSDSKLTVGIVAQPAAAGDFKHLGPAGDFDSDPAAGGAPGFHLFQRLPS